MDARALVTTLVGLAGAIVASILIWLYATSWPANLRFAICLLPLVLWGLVPNVVLWARRRRADTEAGLVRSHKKAVLKLLTPHKLAGRRARYRVPLFLVIGADGVGKSSLITDSGFEPDSGVRIGDTVWWIAEHAIFVEITVSPGQNKTARTIALLATLRPELPLNSILLVLSPADLTLLDHIEYEQLASATASAIHAVEAHTGRQHHPLYVLLTKIDLVPGFREYFDRCELQERNQIWGFDLPYRGLDAPLTGKQASTALTDGFHRLLEVLQVRLLDRLARESDPTCSNRINGFGAQIAMLLPTVRPLFDALIPESNRTWHGAALRGIFLTSSRQEGLSIDPILPQLSGHFGMPRSGTAAPNLGEDEAHWGFFNHGVFNQALRQEAGLALEHAPRRGRWLGHWAAAICTVAALLVCGAFVYQGFNHTASEATHIQTVAAGLQPINDKSGQLVVIVTDLKQLSALAKQAKTAAVSRNIPGISRPARLRAQLAEIRANLRRNALVPHLTALLESQLIDPKADKAALNTRIEIATQSPKADAHTRRGWLQKTADVLLQKPLRQTFVTEGLTALDSGGGLKIDPAYIKAARVLATYREPAS